MGAGKTTFVCEVMKLVAPSVRANSPTFAIVNEYTPRIFHVDLYRTCEDEFDNLGLEEIILGQNVVFIEWPNARVRELVERFRVPSIDIVVPSRIEESVEARVK